MRSRVSGYAYRIAVNLRRRRYRRPAAWPGESARLASRDPAGVVESRDEVLAALGLLPTKQREAVVLVEWLGMDAEETGRLLGIDAACHTRLIPFSKR